MTKAIEILSDPSGLNLSKNKIVVSTSGIVPNIPMVAEKIGCSLAISLHASSDEQRSDIMEINKQYNIKSLLEACLSFVKLSKSINKRITFEYVMLKDFNDSEEDAARLVKLIKRLPCHVNIMYFIILYLF